MERGVLRRTIVVSGLVLALSAAGLSAQSLSGPLVVYNAGSLAVPIDRLLKAFQRGHPDVRPAQENAGSLESARKITELGKVPDVIALADYAIFPKLLLPDHATWYATFATNAMVLAYTPQSTAADRITSENWYQVLQERGVRWGRSEPSLDPAGYRTLMVFQLAEGHYGVPGLADRLLAAGDPRYIRPKEADLIALLQVGELDYAFEYQSLARFHHLPFVSLPREVNLGDPAQADRYAGAVVRLPGKSLAGADSITFRGEPIVYGLTIPVAAPHPDLAQAFVRFVLSPEGRAIVEESGLTPLTDPRFEGHPPADLHP